MRVRRRSPVLAVALVVLVSCGGAPSRDSTSTTGGTTGPRSEVGETVAPERALDDPPLRPAGGVPLVGDEQRMWLSDFRRLAVYELATRRWVTTELPWGDREPSSINLVTDADGVTMVVSFCTAVCDDDLLGPTIDLVVFHAVLERDRIAFQERPGSLSGIEGAGALTIIGSRAGQVLATLSQGGEGARLLTIDETGIREVSATDRDLWICPTDGGFVGIEVVDVDAAGAVPWSPLPEGWEPDPRHALRVVRGPTIEGLAAEEASAEVRPVLANWVGQVVVCTPEGLAIAGQGGGWETGDDGTWTAVASQVDPGILQGFAGAGDRLGDGSRYGRFGTGAVVRAPDGAIRSVASDPVLVGLGDLTLSYERPTSPVVHE